MENHNYSTRRNLKRRLEQDFFSEDQTCYKAWRTTFDDNPTTNILHQISLLNNPFVCPASVKRAVYVLVGCSEDKDLLDEILNCGAAPTLVKYLQVNEDSAIAAKHYQYEVAKDCAIVIELTAIKLLANEYIRNQGIGIAHLSSRTVLDKCRTTKFPLNCLLFNDPEHQQLYVDAGALPCLVDLLRRHKVFTISPPVTDLLKRVALAIASLAHEHDNIKTLVRMEGGIPPLVELLEFSEKKVQRAALQALRTLAFKNDGNKNQIVECNALPTLVLMLRSLDSKLHHEAVGVLGNLVHSSPNIKKEVLLAGALQPVICLLSSGCSESQREAALLLGQFATADSDCKAHIAQRGAIPPLLNMLKSQDAEFQEMSSFALGRLAQDTHNQAGIAHCGGIELFVKLLDSNKLPIQHNAAFCLYGLANNEDNVADIIQVGGLKRLKSGKFENQLTRECVAKTIKRLEEKIQGRVLKHLIYLMCFAEEGVQRRVAIALAYLCSAHDCKTIFIDSNGLKLLLDILKSPNKKQPGDVSPGDASAALHSLAAKARSSVAPFDIAPPSPTPQMYLGEEYINNPKLSDITFLVEGRSFYARRDCLLSSDIFRAMFDGGYREREAKHIVIPNIKWDVFELMMRFIYTGTAEVSVDIAPDLLRAADQYLLDGLKLICEHVIAKEISEINVPQLYKMSEDFNATTLKHACILFMLEKFDNLSSTPWYRPMMRYILPDIDMFFSTLLNSHPADSTIPTV